MANPVLDMTVSWVFSSAAQVEVAAEVFFGSPARVARGTEIVAAAVEELHRKGELEMKGEGEKIRREGIRIGSTHLKEISEDARRKLAAIIYGFGPHWPRVAEEVSTALAEGRFPQSRISIPALASPIVSARTAPAEKPGVNSSMRLIFQQLPTILKAEFYEDPVFGKLFRIPVEYWTEGDHHQFLKLISDSLKRYLTLLTGKLAVGGRPYLAPSAEKEVRAFLDILNRYPFGDPYQEIFTGWFKGGHQPWWLLPKDRLEESIQSQLSRTWEFWVAVAYAGFKSEIFAEWLKQFIKQVIHNPQRFTLPYFGRELAYEIYARYLELRKLAKASVDFPRMYGIVDFASEVRQLIGKENVGNEAVMMFWGNLGRGVGSLMGPGILDRMVGFDPILSHTQLDP